VTDIPRLAWDLSSSPIGDPADAQYSPMSTQLKNPSAPIPVDPQKTMIALLRASPAAGRRCAVTE
jgi:hypothetical protein